VTVLPRTTRLLGGLLLIAVAFGLTIRAHLGLGPWHVLQQGLSRHLDLSLGTAGVILTAAWLLAAVALRELPGPGTLISILAGNALLDQVVPLLPSVHGLALRFATLCLGLVVMSFGAALTFTAMLGIAPLDAVMTGIYRRVPLSLGQVRIAMELVGFLLGWAAGGEIGVGCLVIGLGIGPGIQRWLQVLGAMPAKHVALEEVPA
jgi:uncharacterized membrane protein YczE